MFQSRRVRALAIAVAGLVLLILLGVAMFPFGRFRGEIENTLSRSFNSPARIASIHREQVFSFSPVVDLTDVRVAQPGWVGKGMLATIRHLRVRVHPLSFLVGDFHAELVSAQGVRLDLVRNAQGRENWSDQSSGGGLADMAGVAVRDAVIRYRDAKQKRQFLIAVAIDPDKGLLAEGQGQVNGADVHVSARGGAMRSGQRWPFDARMTGELLNLHAHGSMAGPLKIDDMRFHMRARADNLKRVDRVIEAGLFGTQPVDLNADVERQPDRWIVEKLTGKIGNSPLSGKVTARKVSGRTELDGDVHFTRLNFDDLASDAGLAKAQALKQANGAKLVPDTRVNMTKMGKTDGRIAFDVDRLVSSDGSSALTSIRGVLSLDHRILTVEPLHIGLKHGDITGKVVVDQRGGPPKPKVTLNLYLTNGTITELAGGEAKDVDGSVQARIRLTGTGSTIREAVGNADGSIGAVARSGSMPTKIAALIGFDIGKKILTGDDDRSALRCAAVRLKMHNGLGTVDPLVIDTGISQSRGSGAVRFPTEQINVRLAGAPKDKGVLRVPGLVQFNGTIRNPQIVVPHKTKSFGNILKAVGKAIFGSDDPYASDADCAALSRLAIGRD
ncbi:hypothetical protein GCM10023219_08180 [Stakelama sediminis]|uniref:AsmA domain-containing protein n=1 Tax=Stakelama sediminis TaxID=463200 RepID=A0A840YVG6_9SPHN|nr:hypothetical protein [Stakelama sediminis]